MGWPAPVQEWYTVWLNVNGNTQLFLVINVLQFGMLTPETRFILATIKHVKNQWCIVKQCVFSTEVMTWDQGWSWAEHSPLYTSCLVTVCNFSFYPFFSSHDIFSETTQPFTIKDMLNQIMCTFYLIFWFSKCVKHINLVLNIKLSMEPSLFLQSIKFL